MKKAWMLGLLMVGCAPRSAYRIDFKYVNPPENKEVRQVSGYVSGSGFSSNSNLIEFPRSFQMLYDAFIEKWKK